ncbi:MAG TPA: hypothetical protein VEB20_22725 [Azospirillaceae bacterium]|nr:hypothetical protein [Azospirillaceae bacterium]
MPPPPDRDRTSRQTEAKALFAALRDHAVEAMLLAEKARTDPARFRDHAYYGFREKLTDFQALASLLERRIDETAKDWRLRQEGSAAKAEEARQQFDRLDLMMLSLFVRTSRRYFTLLAISDTRALGAAERLSRDLQALHEALRRLREPAMRGRADPTLEAELTTAILILNDLIGRQTPLTDFDAAPGRGG